MTHDFDLTTDAGIEQAQLMLAQARRENAIKEFHASVEADKDTEALEDQLSEIRILNRFIEQSQRPQPQVFDMSNLTTKDIEGYDTPWLIDSILPADRLTLFTGDGGIGKSYMMLQFVAGLAMGIQHHTFVPKALDEIELTHKTEACKITYASYEESMIEAAKRLWRIENVLKWANEEKIREQVEFIDLKDFGPLWGVEQEKHYSTRARLLNVGSYVMGAAKQHESQLLIIDPSAGAFGANENERSAVREFTSYLNGWGQDEKCATILIAHPPKSDQTYSGSTDWLASCRMFWTLQTDKRKGVAQDRDLRIYKQKAQKVDKIIDVSHFVFGTSKSSYGMAEAYRPLRKPTPDEIEDYPEDKYPFTPIWIAAEKEEAEMFYARFMKDDDQLEALWGEKDKNDGDEEDNDDDYITELTAEN